MSEEDRKWLQRMSKPTLSWLAPDFGMLAEVVGRLLTGLDELKKDVERVDRTSATTLALRIVQDSIAELQHQVGGLQTREGDGLKASSQEQRASGVDTRPDSPSGLRALEIEVCSALGIDAEEYCEACSHAVHSRLSVLSASTAAPLAASRGRLS